MANLRSAASRYGKKVDRLTPGDTKDPKVAQAKALARTRRVQAGRKAAMGRTR